MADVDLEFLLISSFDGNNFLPFPYLNSCTMSQLQIGILGSQTHLIVSLLKISLTILSSREWYVKQTITPFGFINFLILFIEDDISSNSLFI